MWKAKRRYSSMAPSPSSSPFPFPSNSPPLLLSHSQVHKSVFPPKYLWPILGVSLATIFIGFIIFCCAKRRFFGLFSLCRRKGTLKWKKIELRRFQLEEVEKATQNFSRECMVGSGAFGNVYRGTFDAEGTLAIKRACVDSYQSVQEFRNEVELLSRVKHRNLVGLVGFCEEAGQKILVYEYVPNGSLLDYIVGRRGKSLTWMQRVNIAIGAAKGIAHLHEGVKPSIIHRDLKPSNILVGDCYEAKVSDFGLVKLGPIGDQSHVSSQVKGTPGYLDPAYCNSFHLTPFSDVYSFGVILLQLVAARPAVDTARSQYQYHIIEWARPSLERGTVEDILDANMLMGEPCNMEMMLKMGQLGLRCVVKVPKERPTMAQVWRELEETLNSTHNFIHKQPSRGSHRSVDREDSQSFVSIDGVRLQRFNVDLDGLSIHSASMRCLEANSISIDGGEHNLRGIDEEADIEDAATLARH